MRVFVRVSFLDFQTMIRGGGIIDYEIDETGIQLYAVALNGSLEWCDFDKRFGDNLVRPINPEQKFYFSIMTHPQICTLFPLQ